MSIENIYDKDIDGRHLSTPPSLSKPDIEPWVRNPSWLTLPTVTGTEQKFVGLHAIWPGDSNPININAAGDYKYSFYTDGDLTNRLSGTSISTNISYDTPILDGTNAPVTFDFNSNTVNRDNHGYTDGMKVDLYNITPSMNDTLTTYSDTSRLWQDIVSFGGDVYACVNNGNIYKQTDGVGNFVSMSGSFGSWSGICASDTDLYACSIGGAGGVYRWTGSDFSERISTIIRSYYDVVAVGSDLYACVLGGRIYKRTGGVGDFVEVPGQTVNRNWTRMTSLNGYVYACVLTGDIYKQDIDGVFQPLNQPNSDWWGLTSFGGNVYASMSDGTIYRQNSGVGDFLSISFIPLTTSTSYRGICSFNDKIYMCGNNFSSFYSFIPSSIENIQYYTKNVTPNSFQLSLDGNTIVDMYGTNGTTATLLPYKQTIVTIVPQDGVNLTMVDIGTQLTQYSPDTSKTYSTSWLDVCVGSPNLTSIKVSLATPGVYHNHLERFELVSSGLSGSSLGYLFNKLYKLKSVKMNLSDKSVSLVNTFIYCYSLQNIELYGTSNVTTMSNTFTDCYSLQSVPLFDTSSVTYMAAMFSNCRSLQSVPLFNTINVDTMNGMFAGCTSLQTVPLFNTSSVNTMSTMFSGCTSLQSVPLFDTSKVVSFYQMFLGCTSLKSVPPFNTTSASLLGQMFSGCYSLETITLPPIPSNINISCDMANMFQNCHSLMSVNIYNTSNSTNMNRMFTSCYSLVIVSFSNTSRVTDTSNMFQNCNSLKSVPLFDTGNVTNMSSMFDSCRYLQSVPLFDTGNTVVMNNMFQYCTSLKSIPPLDTSSVTTTSQMFYGCASLETIPFNTDNLTSNGKVGIQNGNKITRTQDIFDTSGVTNMSSMFAGCISLQSVPSFNTINVTNMGDMFNGCRSLQSVPFFNTSKVTSMSNMFQGCLSLQSVPLFDTGNAISMNSMFYNCTSLRSVPLFSTSKVTNMNSMLYGCTSLRLVPLFDTTKVTNIGNMFYGCTSLQLIPEFNLSSVTLIGNVFYGCSSLSSMLSTGIKVSFSVDNCNLSGPALNTIYSNLSTGVTSKIITVNGNWGTTTDNPDLVPLGWTVSG